MSPPGATPEDQTPSISSLSTVGQQTRHHLGLPPTFALTNSPELNPVELLNGDLKHHVARANPASKTDLAAEADRHLRRRQNQPNVVKALFGKPEVRYAAD